VFCLWRGRRRSRCFLPGAGKSDGATRRARRGRPAGGPRLPVYSLSRAGTSRRRARRALGISPSPCNTASPSPARSGRKRPRILVQDPAPGYSHPFPVEKSIASLGKREVPLWGPLRGGVQAPFTHRCWETLGRINPTPVSRQSSPVTHPGATLCPVNVTWCPLSCPQAEFFLGHGPPSPSVALAGGSRSFRAPRRCGLQVPPPPSPPSSGSWREAEIGGRGGKRAWGGGCGGVW